MQQPMAVQMRGKEHHHPKLDACGFVCPSCNFWLLLSDLRVSKLILEGFKAGVAHVEINCPECDKTRAYSRTDLTLFLPGADVL